jgi:hypothetical protein
MAAAQAPRPSYYPYRLADARAVYLEKPGLAVHGDGISDDAPALQSAIDRVEETAKAGIVFVPEGKYRLGRTVNVWRGIRLIGFGSRRPVFVLGERTPGFDSGDGKYMIHFCNFRPKPGQPIADARGETFFSGIYNIDMEIHDGNPAAVAVRFHVAQLCSLSHMDFRIGSAKAGVEAIGSQIEDCRFFGGEYGILSGPTSEGWQVLLLDCLFDGQRKTAVETNKTGLTVIRDQFRNSPRALAVTEHANEKLFVKDSRFEGIPEAGILVSNYADPETQVNIENVECSDVPVFLAFRDAAAPEKSRQFPAKARIYAVRRFAHGLHYANAGAKEASPRIETSIDWSPLDSLGPLPAKDFPELPARDSWVNIATLGAKGDGSADDTAVFKQAIAKHRTIYVPTGRYRLSDTLTLRPDTVLIGLSPMATRFVVTSSTRGFMDPAHPRPVIETAKGGDNIFTGIGVEPNYNKGAIAVKWTAGRNSYLDDFYMPYTEQNVTPATGEYLGLWVTDDGGGTFKNMWNPNRLAPDGFRVTGTSTEGRVYLASVEHHLGPEVTMKDAANWTWYDLQTETKIGEGIAYDVDACKNISFVNLFIYRMPTTPSPYAIRMRHSGNIVFRGVHNFHWRGKAFEATLFDPDRNMTVREHELSFLEIR